MCVLQNNYSNKKGVVKKPYFMSEFITDDSFRTRLEPANRRFEPIFSFVSTVFAPGKARSI